MGTGREPSHQVEAAIVCHLFLYFFTFKNLPSKTKSSAGVQWVEVH